MIKKAEFLIQPFYLYNNCISVHLFTHGVVLVCEEKNKKSNLVFNKKHITPFVKATKTKNGLEENIPPERKTVTDSSLKIERYIPPLVPLCLAGCLVR